MKNLNKKFIIYGLIFTMLSCMVLLSGCSIIDNASTQTETTTQAKSNEQSKKSSSFTAASSASSPSAIQNIDDNTTVYYQYGSYVYYLKEDDNALKDSKDIRSTTLYDAKSRGMKLAN